MSSASQASHPLQASLSVTRASVGANRARMPKKTENASPLRSQVSLPKSDIPAQVALEYSRVRNAMLRGVAEPGNTSSTQTKAAKSARAGQTSQRTG